MGSVADPDAFCSAPDPLFLLKFIHYFYILKCYIPRTINLVRIRNTAIVGTYFLNLVPLQAPYSPTNGEEPQRLFPTSPSLDQYFEVGSYRPITVGWSVEIFLIGQNRATNQRSGIILEVQIRSFSARRRTRVKVFIFKKFQGI